MGFKDFFGFNIKPVMDKPVVPSEQKRYMPDGMKLDRLNGDWFGSMLSPNQEVRAGFTLVRSRARDLVENSPVMQGYVGLLQQNLTPFKVQSKVGNARKGINRTASKIIEDAWEEHCKPGNFEVSGRFSFDECVKMWAQAWATDGEVLARHLFGQGPDGYCVQLLNSDLLAKETYDGASKSSLYSMGVERDEWDRVIKYWIHSRYPQESANGGPLLKLSPNEVIHAFKPHQIGACRGLPPCMASMTLIKQLDKYRQAEVTAALVGSCTAVFYTQDGSVTADPYNGAGAGPAAGSPAPINEGGVALDGPIGGQILEPGVTTNHLEPGMAEALPAGVTPHFLNPSHPATAFDAFTRSLKLDIAAGLKLSYNILYGDWQSTSFSSMKAAYNQDKQFLEDLQDFFIQKILDPIYENWIEWACMKGIIDLPAVGGNYDIYKDHKFIAPAFPFADPLKDIQAQIADFGLGTTSKSRLAAARGESYEEILLERQHDRELETHYGETDETVKPTNDPALGKPGAPANTQVQGPIKPNNFATEPDPTAQDQGKQSK